MQRQALMVGNSDGIGLATTKRLLTAGWNIIGISKSESPIKSPHYHHRLLDVSDRNYSGGLDKLLSEYSVNFLLP